MKAYRKWKVDLNKLSVIEEFSEKWFETRENSFVTSPILYLSFFFLFSQYKFSEEHLLQGRGCFLSFETAS